MKFPVSTLAIFGATVVALSGADLEDTIRHYNHDRMVVGRAYELPWSEVRSERFDALYREWQGKLAGLEFERLDQQGRIDYVLLRNEVTSEMERQTVQQQRLREMEELLSFRAPIQQLEARRWKLEALDAQAAAATVSELAEKVKKLKERVEKGRKAKTNEIAAADAAKEDAPIKLTPSVGRRAAGAVNDIRNTLKSWYSFYDGYQPDFSWWLKKPYDEASANLESLSKYLREEVAEQKGKDEDPLLGEVLGRDALVRDIASELLPYSPEELIRIGEKEFAWCESEMKKAAKEMGFDDWKKALAKVKSAFVPPGQQDELVSKFAREATDFVKTNNLITVSPLAEEVWRLTMISPESQKTIPYVAYGGQAVMVAYAKDEMKHEDKLMSMRGNNRHFTRITTAHELIPGHHLQIFYGDRNRQYRALFNTPFLTEGWCLYWEIRLWDLGYGKTPEDRIGMLFWRMHRCARIIVSLKYHLGEMQPKEMVSFLVDRVGHEKLGATSEVRRFIGGSYPPLYQAGYMIGGLQLNALHKEIVGSGKMTEKQFHDTVLTYNSIPVELIRAGMLNLPLTRDYKSSWRFYGELQ